MKKGVKGNYKHYELFRFEVNLCKLKYGKREMEGEKDPWERVKQ